MPQGGVDGEALLVHEAVTHAPRVVGELVGELLGRVVITVGGHDHRPAGLLDVEPRLHGEERDGEGAAVRFQRPGPVEPFLHRPVRRQVLLLVRDHGHVAPRHRRRDVTGEVPQGQACQIVGGLERIVRLGAEREEQIALVRHLLGEVGVMVEHQPQRDLRAGCRPDDGEDVPFDVVDSVGRRGAVEQDQQPVHGQQFAQAGRESTAQLVERVSCQPPA